MISQFSVVKYYIEIVDYLIREGRIGEITKIKDIFDIVFLAQALLDYSFIFGKYLGCSASNDSEAENCNVYHNQKPFAKIKLILYNNTFYDKLQINIEKKYKIC